MDTVFHQSVTSLFLFGLSLQATTALNYKSRPEYRQSKIPVSGLAVKLYPVQITLKS